MSERKDGGEAETPERCVAGCLSFDGGEKRHHKDCPFYPESLSKLHAETASLLDEAVEALEACEQEIDNYIRQEYPLDHPVHERYRQRDFAANPARATLAKIRSKT